MTIVHPRLAMRQEMQEALHDAWRIVSHLEDHLEILHQSPLLVGEAKVAADEAHAMLAELNERLEELRARILTMVG